MNFRALFAEYGLPAALAFVLYIFLPPILTPYLGFAQTYVTGAVAVIIFVISIWVAKRTRKYIE